MFVQRGDQRLFVAVDGEGPGLFFAHGLFGTHEDGAWLSGPGATHRLIAPDLRGRGASSPARKTSQHTFDEHAADAIEILDRLEVDTAVVGGVSFGAAVAIALALRHPSRVRAVLLITSAFGGSAEAMGEGDLASYGRLGERIAAGGLENVAREEAARTGSDRPIRRWMQHDEASLVAWLRAVPLYRPFERIEDLKRIEAPTLVVPGRDAIHTRELSESYAAALPTATLAASTASLSTTVAEFLARHGDF